MPMIPDIERATPAEIERFQEEKLKELVRYVYAYSPYYKRIFTENKLLPEDITTIESLKKIPLTTKEQLQEHNDAFFCVQKRKIIDYVTTSGTLGEPVTIALTDKDLERLGYNEALSFVCSEVTGDDVLQLMTTMDRRFMAGMAYFLGARRLGAGIIRVGSGVPELQWDSIQKFKPTYVITVPSFLLKLIEYAKEHNIDLATSGIKGAICIGESIREQDFSLNTLAEKIKSQWDIELFSTYASTEMSTAFNECRYHVGGHHHPELIIVEILDEDNNRVAPGETGELVITTLGVEAMPLLRFKTGDLVKVHDAPCNCGRTTLRLGPVVGRKKQMIKYKGTTLYPPAMYTILNHFDEIDRFVIEVSHNELGTDEILIKIATGEDTAVLLGKIRDHFRAKLRVTPRVEFCAIGEIEKVQGSKLSRKPTYLIDKRK